MLEVSLLCVLSNSTGVRIVVAHARVGRHMYTIFFYF